MIDEALRYHACVTGDCSHSHANDCLSQLVIAINTHKVPEPPHVPPFGSLYRHYKGGYYRRLFEVRGHVAPASVPVSPYDRQLLRAMDASNDAKVPYAVAPIYSGASGLYTVLPYDLVTLYISQETLCLYARKTDEFYGWITLRAGGQIRRFALAEGFSP